MDNQGLLLVEDDGDDAELILRMVRASFAHRRVRLARSGPEALAILRGTPGQAPALVLLSLKLDWMGVLRAVRAEPASAGLPVVILGAFRDAREIAAAYDAGASSCVETPARFEAFAEAVRAIGTYWLGMNLLPARSGQP